MVLHLLLKSTSALTQLNGVMPSICVEAVGPMGILVMPQSLFAAFFARQAPLLRVVCGRFFALVIARWATPLRAGICSSSLIKPFARWAMIVVVARWEMLVLLDYNIFPRRAMMF